MNAAVIWSGITGDNCQSILAIIEKPTSCNHV